jgi:tight adherence protein C
MFEQITAFFGSVGSAGGLIILGIFVGALLIVYGFFGGLVSADPVGRRYHAGSPANLGAFMA